MNNVINEEHKDIVSRNNNVRIITTPAISNIKGGGHSENILSDVTSVIFSFTYRYFIRCEELIKVHLAAMFVYGECDVGDELVDLIERVHLTVERGDLE